MVQEKRCRRIQPTQGAAGITFQLKDGGSSIVLAKSICYQFMMLKEKECWKIINFTCSVIAETECACEVDLLGYSMHGGVGATATRWCRARSSRMTFAHGLGSRLIAIRVFEAYGTGWHCVLGGIVTHYKAGSSPLDKLYFPSLFLGEWIQQEKAYSKMGRTCICMPVPLFCVDSLACVCTGNQVLLCC